MIEERVRRGLAGQTLTRKPGGQILCDQEGPERASVRTRGGEIVGGKQIRRDLKPVMGSSRMNGVDREGLGSLLLLTKAHAGGAGFDDGCEVDEGGGRVWRREGEEAAPVGKRRRQKARLSQQAAGSPHNICTFARWNKRADSPLEGSRIVQRSHPLSSAPTAVGRHASQTRRRLVASVSRAVIPAGRGMSAATRAHASPVQPYRRPCITYSCVLSGFVLSVGIVWALAARWRQWTRPAFTQAQASKVQESVVRRLCESLHSLHISCSAEA